jgi:hypothetical protein
MSCDKHACHATSEYVTRRAHMSCGKHTCHATSEYVVQQVNMLRNKHICHATSKHVARQKALAFLVKFSPFFSNPPAPAASDGWDVGGPRPRDDHCSTHSIVRAAQHSIRRAEGRRSHLDDRAADRKDVSGIDVTKLPFRPENYSD